MAKVTKTKKPKVPTTLQLIKLTNAAIQRTSCEVLSGALLQPAGATTSVYRATDMDVTVTVGLDIVTDRDTLINPRAMVAALPLVPAGESIAVRDNALAGVGGVNLAESKVEDYPTMPPRIGKTAETSRHVFTVAELTDALDFVVRAVSSEETRYYLNGIYLHQHNMADIGDGTGKAGVLRMVATDGHRLHIRTFTGSASPSTRRDGSPAVIVPRRAVAMIVKALALYSPDTWAEMEWCETGFVFRLGRVLVESKIIDSTFPDYVRVIPSLEDVTHTIPVPAAERAAMALAHRATVARINEGSVRKNAEQCTVCAVPGGVIVPMYRHQAEGAVAWFNGAYVLDILRDDAAVFHIVDFGSPARVTYPERPGYLGVTMPMRGDSGSVPEHHTKAAEREAAELASVPAPVDNTTRLDAWCAIMKAPKAARGDVPSWDRCEPAMAAAVWCGVLACSLGDGADSATITTVTAPPPDGYMAAPPALGAVVELAAYRSQAWSPAALRPANDDAGADLAVITARGVPWQGVAGYGDD